MNISLLDIAPCGLVEAYRRFRGTCYLHHHVDNDVSPLTRVHGAISQKAVIFILAVLRT
jgi:hypothetical protein